MPILRDQACVSAVWPSPTVGRPGSQPASTSSTGPRTKNQKPETRNPKPETSKKKKKKERNKTSPHPLVSVLPSSDQSTSESHHTNCTVHDRPKLTDRRRLVGRICFKLRQAPATSSTEERQWAMEIPIAIPIPIPIPVAIPIAIAIAIFGADHRRGTVLYGTNTLRSVPYGKIFDVQHGGDQEVRYHVGALLSFPRSFDSDFRWWSILNDVLCSITISAMPLGYVQYDAGQLLLCSRPVKPAGPARPLRRNTPHPMNSGTASPTQPITTNAIPPTR
jgi:hypothetical protein